MSEILVLCTTGQKFGEFTEEELKAEYENLKKKFG
jgi:hypothetical protein